jgi:hypothetical protein
MHTISPFDPCACPTHAHLSVAGHLKQLRQLELLRASPSVTEALFPLQFLPHLTSLTLSLDIPGAYPAPLSEVPPQLQELVLGNMWLQQLPADMAGLTGEVGGYERGAGYWLLPCRAMEAKGGGVHKSS